MGWGPGPCMYPNLTHWCVHEDVHHGDEYTRTRARCAGRAVSLTGYHRLMVVLLYDINVMSLDVDELGSARGNRSVG